VKQSITGFIVRRLKLKVNEQKSAVARPAERKFVGFSLTRTREPKRRIAAKSLVRFKQRMRKLTVRTRGISIEQMTKELSYYLRGWKSCFGFVETPSLLRKLDQWIRQRMQSVIWKKWKCCRRRFARLRQRGVWGDLAAQTAGSSHGPRYIANSPAMKFAFPNGYFAEIGLPQLFTVVSLNLTEPPDADPHVRWCGRGGEATLPPIPMCAAHSSY
jgi:RNA-directed DNA polymerase